jgi:hypothetical protein
MAKVKKHKKPVTRRHHRRAGIGAMSPQIENVVYGVAGAIAGNLVIGFIPDILSASNASATKYNPVIKGAIIAGVGVLLSSKGKSPALKAIGTGMAIGGGVKVFTGVTGMGGFSDGVPMIAAFNRMRQVSGMTQASLPSSSPNITPRDFGIGAVKNMVAGRSTFPGRLNRANR